VGTIHGFFTAAEAARIARLPRATLDYWTRTGLVHASRRSARPRLYAFEDLRDIVAARKLREGGARLPSIREAIEKLRRIDEPERLAQAELAVIGKNVVFRNRGKGIDPADLNKGGVGVFAVTISEIFDELGTNDLGDLRIRANSRVEIDPDVRGGTPVVAGTRIPTQIIADLASEGLSPDDIRELYPSLKVEDVEAALEYEREGVDAPGGSRLRSVGG